MDTVLFNFYDLILIITAFECLLFALLVAVVSRVQLQTLFFIGFLLCHALIPLHELIFWGERFRLWMVEISPNVFFIGSYAYFLVGALLYFFIRSLLIRDYRLSRASAIHLLPVVIYACAMFVVFYGMDHAHKMETIVTQHIAYSAPFLYFDAFGRFLRLAYGIACLYTIYRYRQQLEESYGTLQHSTLMWLNVMTISIVLLYAWEAGLLTLKLHYLHTDNFDGDLLQWLGTTAYIMTFIVLNLLIFLKLSLFQKVAMVEALEIDPPTAVESEVDQAHVSRIEAAMNEARVYRNADLTLDDLSAAVEIPARQLSQIIKLTYRKNFYEFINDYRIEEAKRLLVDPEYRDRKIMEVYLDSGFNSKSVFNVVFKNSEKMTPSQYKKLHSD